MTTRTGRARWAALIVAFGLVLVACGGSGGKDDEGVKASAPADSSGTTAGDSDTTGVEATTPEPTTRDIGLTGWWGGFKITVDKASTEPSGTGVNVTVDVTWENLSSQAAAPPQPYIDNGGAVLDPSSDAGQAAGNAAVKGKLTTYVDNPDAKTADDILDGLKVVFGQASDNQTIIPLEKGGDVTTYEPQDVAALTGKITTPTVVAELSKGSVGWSFDSGDKGVYLITAVIKLTCGATCPPEGTSVGKTDFTLTVPGETTPISASDKSGYCCSAIYPGDVDDKPTNTLIFEVNDEPKGTFTITYKPERTPPVPGSIDFTL